MPRTTGGVTHARKRKRVLKRASGFRASPGTQYRSAIYVGDDARRAEAVQSRDRYQRALSARGFGKITTEICGAQPFYYAEDYHQQYLAKNPGGYCGLGGCGVPYRATA